MALGRCDVTTATHVHHDPKRGSFPFFLVCPFHYLWLSFGGLLWPLGRRLASRGVGLGRLEVGEHLARPDDLAARAVEARAHDADIVRLVVVRPL